MKRTYDDKYREGLEEGEVGDVSEPVRRGPQVAVQQVAAEKRAEDLEHGRRCDEEAAEDEGHVGVHQEDVDDGQAEVRQHLVAHRRVAAVVV